MYLPLCVKYYYDKHWHPPKKKKNILVLVLTEVYNLATSRND